MSLELFCSRILKHSINITFVAILIKKIAKSLEFLHSVGIIHRDISMDTIDVKTVKQERRPNKKIQFPIKLQMTGFDFAFCFEKNSNEVSQSFLIEDKMFAPEISAGIAHGAGSDVWGLGTIATELLALANCPDEHPLKIFALSMV